MRIETPRGAVVHTPNGQSAQLIWNPNFQPNWEGRYDRAQIFVDSEVLRLSAPYIPFQTSMLQKSGILGTIPGKGVVTWIAPYAHYQYYGEIMAGRAPKHYTGRPLGYHGAPMRGKLWFERMKAAHKQDILAGARRIAGGNT